MLSNDDSIMTDDSSPNHSNLITDDEDDVDNDSNIAKNEVKAVPKKSK